MATREEITTLISYVLGEKNRQLLITSGLDALPKENRIIALRGLQDLGWIGHGGLADFAESYSLTRDGRRIASDPPPLEKLPICVREHVDALRMVDSETNCGKKVALRKLIEIECKLGNWDSAQICCFDLKRAADKTKDTEAAAFSFFYQGRAEVAQNRWDEALESYLRALEMYMESGNRKGVSATNCSMGVVYGNKGDHASAIRCFESSIALAREIGDSEQQAKAMMNLAIVQDLEGRFEESEKISKSCLQHFLESEDNNMAARVANNLGVLHMTRQMFDVAAEYFEKTIMACRADKNSEVLGAALVNAGYCYARMKDLARAMGYTDEAVSIFREPNNQNMIALAYRNYGNIEMQNSHPDRAFEWFEKSVRAAKISGVEDTMAACCLEYGVSLIETMADLRLAKKLLKRSSSIYRDLGNAEQARIAEARLAAI